MDSQTILHLILGVFCGVFVYFILDRGYNLWADRYENNERFNKEFQTLHLEALAELQRRSGPSANAVTLGLLDSILEYEALRLRDDWVKISFMSLEDKVLALRAGIPPKKARKAFITMGRDVLAAQAALRTLSSPSAV